MSRREQFLETMLRMYLPQARFSLSDEGKEDEIYNSYAMRRFLGLDFTLEQVPDATALLSFRHLLEKYALGKNLLDSRPEIFEDHRWILRGGNIVDVTIIPAPSLAKSASGARDPEMCQTKKADQWHFGMKAKVDVDAGPDSAAQSCTESVRAKIEYPSLNAPTADHPRPARPTSR